jgi:type IV pilus assembly protein PilY1
MAEVKQVGKVMFASRMRASIGSLRLLAALRRLVMPLLVASMAVASLQAAVLPTVLSDIPTYSANNVPANLMLAMSVEWPTGVVAAYTDGSIPLVYTDARGNVQTIACAGLVAGRGICYFPSMNYLGYFDYDKCYDYDRSNKYFVPVGTSTAHNCTGHWSGNMLNWATMTKLDEFRKVLTGGYRSTDTTSLTVLERARNTAQGGMINPAVKQLDGADNVVPGSVIGDATFSSASTVYIRSNDNNTELTDCSDPTADATCSGNDRGIFFQIADNSCFLSGVGDGICTDPSANHMRQYYARVQVCVPGMLESNCNSAHAAADYPGAGAYNKPDGLIQQNYQRIRVGAAAYEHDDGSAQPNGSLRALLRDNGPTRYNGFGTRTANANAEWDAASGIFASNPDPEDMAHSSTYDTLSASGAINYLNQFGRVATEYESWDSVSELYYVALAYFKHHALEAPYAINLPVSASEADGFPVLHDHLNDPVQYTCQANAIVTVGDSHTWFDTAVPGASFSGIHTRLAPLAAAGSDPGLNTYAWLTAINSLPLVETDPATTLHSITGDDIGRLYVVGGGTRGTYNIAGMAYYAHTQNMRPDLIDGIAGKEGAKVTVDTYVVDVMEPGSFDGSATYPTYDPALLGMGHGPNQYWLAAKFGGFSVDDSQCTATSPPAACVSISGVQVPTPESVLSWHTNSTSVAGMDLRPDNYYPGNRPDLIQSGLSTIFAQVVSRRTLSAGAPAVASSRVLSAANSAYHAPKTGVPVYQTAYVPGVWTGDIVGMLDAVNATTGGTTTVANWHAQNQVDKLTSAMTAPPVPKPWSTARRIVTFNASTRTGVPFRFANLSATQQAYFPGDTATASPLIDYLRGDRSNEGVKYRVRTHTLGDIVGSGVTLVQDALSASFSDAFNPGYSTFALSVATRAPVVYAGANDGMLHAFAGGFTSGPASPDNPFVDTAGNPLGGTELYAYVPSFVLRGPNAMPDADGLPALANLAGVTAHAFSHHFYVDATPQVADVDFDWSCSSPGSACSRGALPQWHTILVGGLGKGGKGIYALDVTTPPAALDTSGSATTEPAIASNVLWEFSDADMGYSYSRPVVAKTRKYGWVVLVTSGYDNTRDGKGYLYVLSASSGALLEKLATTAGSATNPSGLASPTPFTQDASDGTIEQVYAGDLRGNVWRFDLSGTSTYPAPVLFATLQDGGGAAQPVTTAPRIEVDIDSSGLGTRRWVFVGTGRFLDVSDVNSVQQQTMYALRDGTSAVPSASGLPLIRTALLADTNLTTGVDIADNDSGWYYDLPEVAPSGAAERIVVDPDAVSGLPIVAWASLVPTSDPCQFAGQQYAVNFGTGRTVLQSASGALIPNLRFAQGLTSSEIVQIPADGSSPTQFSILGQPLSGAPIISLLQGPGIGSEVGRANWREILN